MATEKVDSVLEISALSRPLHLGTLYNARNHSIVPGMSLWSNEEIQQKTTVHEQASTKYTVKTADSFGEKTELLDLNGSLKLSVLAGLVGVTGSAKYLKSKRTSSHQCSVTMQYQVTTVSKKLKVNDLKILYPQVFKEAEPTHVVIEVLYGANALMEFQSMVSNETEKSKFKGNLETIVAKIPKVNVDMNGKVKLKPEEKREMENISCTFYGDIQLKENPSTYEEAVKVYKDLPSLLGPNSGKAVPVKVWLYPLKRLNNMAAKLTNEISECVMSEVGKVVDDLHQARLTTSDLIVKCKAVNISDIVYKLERFQTSLNVFTTEFLNKVKELLPAIRGGTTEESALKNILTSLSASGFSKNDMDAWIHGKTTEVDLVTAFIKEICETEHCKFKCPGPELQSFLRSTQNDVVMFCFTSLNDEEPYLQKIEHSSPNASLPEENTTEITPWYKTTTVNAALRVFRRQKDCQKIISFITDTDHPGASVRIYHQNKLKFKNLKLQDRAKFSYKLMTLSVSKNDNIRKNLEAFKLGHRSAKHLRFMVYGPVGHGKSSFINSVNSVFQEHICVGALAAALSDISFTLKYKTHQIKNKGKRPLPFVFSDIMGLESDEGIKADDIITCMGGHVGDNYEFNVYTRLHEGDVNYNENPSVDDKVHCLVTVVSAEKISLLSADIIKKMKDIISHATDIGIPVAVVMTNVDKACPDVRMDLNNISSSKSIQRKIIECQERLEIFNQGCILPVKNYHDEIRMDPRIDCLILRAFKELVVCANSYIQCL